MQDANTSQEREQPLVVVINDDVHWCHGVADILTLAGYQVVEGFDGVEAVDLTIKHLPDLLLVNEEMPRKRGSQAIGELRKRGINIPILMCSAHDLSYSEIAFASGASGYVRLPVDADVLLRAVSLFIPLDNDDSP